MLKLSVLLLDYTVWAHRDGNVRHQVVYMHTYRLDETRRHAHGAVAPPMWCIRHLDVGVSCMTSPPAPAVETCAAVARVGRGGGGGGQEAVIDQARQYGQRHLEGQLTRQLVEHQAEKLAAQKTVAEMTYFVSSSATSKFNQSIYR